MPISKSKGNQFEEQIEQLLRLKGYFVRRNELINGTQIDLIARKNDFLDNLCFVVECADRQNPIGIELVKQKAAVLLTLRDSRFLYRLLFVAKSGFSAEAKAYADSQANILLITLSDLENQLIDFGSYIDWYLHNYEHSSGIFKEGNLFANYVELTARDEQENIVPSLTEEIRRWLSQDSNNLLFLLGEYGSGKTSLSRQLVYTLLSEKYRAFQSQPYTPILINLREHRSGSPNLQQVITDTLINQYGVPLASFSAFEHVCSSGNILLVLDGFDEMADKSDKQTLVDSFNQIYLIASLNAKVLLTCRSNFFHSHTDVIELLRQFSINIPYTETRSPRIAELSFENQGRILYVEKLSQDQIRLFIARRFGGDAKKIFNQIESIHDLSDLSTRPVLLDMILTTLPELTKAKSRINSAALYEHYTNKWTARDDWRVKIPLNIRQEFCEILAWVMHNSDLQEIGFPLLEKAMINSLEHIAESESQLETFKNDLQTCSFLVRVGRQEQFRFAHKSFLEYFVARKIITELLSGAAIQKPKSQESYVAPEPLSRVVSNPETVASELPISPLVVFAFGSTYDDWGLSHYRSLLGTVRERLRRSDAFVTFRDAEVTRRWPGAASNVAVRSHLEDQIRSIIGKQKPSDKAEYFNLSEEIATFAIEYLENLKVDLEKFIKKLKDEDAVAIFSDILRLSKSSDIVKSHGKYMKAYLESGEHELLKISFCASLAKIPELINIRFVKHARKVLSPDGWSYFLFELASSGKDYQRILAECFEWDALSTVDKIICIHGIKGKIEKAPNDLISGALIDQLIHSPNLKERRLGLTLCHTTFVPEETLHGLMVDLMAKEPDDGLKEEAIMLLGTLSGTKFWQSIKGLWAKEKNPRLKKLLKTTEQSIRDNRSKERGRVSWESAKANRAVRDRLWLSLRQ